MCGEAACDMFPFGEMSLGHDGRVLGSAVCQGAPSTLWPHSTPKIPPSAQVTTQPKTTLACWASQTFSGNSTTNSSLLTCDTFPPEIGCFSHDFSRRQIHMHFAGKAKKDEKTGGK